MVVNNLQQNFKPSGFFVLRTPLLPFDELLQWGEGLGASATIADSERLQEVLNNDRHCLRSRLYQALARPEVRDALFVASPDLDEAFDVWRREPDSARGKRIERALVRYFFRMAGRATPFGLFSGCSVGQLGAETRLVVGKRAKYKRRTRLDMGYLAALTEKIRSDRTLKYSLIYRPNSSLYPAAGRLRYIESKSNGHFLSHNLVAIERTEHVRATLELAKDGADPLQLASALVDKEAEISLDEAKEYIEELIDNQVLVANLEPPVIAAEPIDDLISQLKQVAGGVQAASRLEETKAELEALDAHGLGVSPESYRRVAKSLEDLPGKVDIQRLFQVDMVAPACGATLGSELINEILRGVGILHRISGSHDDALQQFREAFVDRYENREVPLVEVLDDEMGIGFGRARSAEASLLLEGLALAPVRDEQMALQWNNRQSRLLRKLLDAYQSGAAEIVFNQDDIEALASANPPPLPDAFAVLAKIAAPSEQALAQGNFQVEIMSIGGPSGANLLGRFCHVDESLLHYVKQHLREEEAIHPHAVFAEIVHLSAGRLGNVICRPALREHEIVYLGRATGPPSHQISITDLNVSVFGKRVVLRSSKLGREILPRLTTAHNYNHPRNLVVYQFLCALQEQGTASAVGWDWGALGQVPFLPRVVHGRLILSRARWNLSPEDLNSLIKTSSDESFQAIQKLRASLKLPRFLALALAGADTELPIDLENILSIESFIELIKGSQGVALVEMFSSGPDELCACGPEGKFAHELVVPFLQTRSATRGSSTPVANTARRTERTFPPGSEWLYVKLYTGTSTADRVLCDLVRPVAREAQESGAVDRWFFVRYADPKWHLRLRLHGPAERLHAEVLPSLQTTASMLLADGRLWRMQIDTYEREIERYGGLQGSLLAEELFHADSEALLSILEALPGDEGSNTRWLLSLRAIDILLTHFGFDLEGKRAAMKEICQVFSYEFEANLQLKHQLGHKYRRERKRIENILNPANDEASNVRLGLVVLEHYSSRLAPVIARLKAFAETGQLHWPIKKLLPHFTHMHANRFFRSAQRAQEFIVYDFLRRFYESRLAQAQSR